MKNRKQLELEIKNILNAIKKGKKYLSDKYPLSQKEIEFIFEKIEEAIEENFPELKGKVVFSLDGENQDSLLYSIAGIILGGIGGWLAGEEEGAIIGALLGGAAGYGVSKIRVRVVRDNNLVSLQVVPN